MSNSIFDRDMSGFTKDTSLFHEGDEIECCDNLEWGQIFRGWYRGPSHPGVFANGQIMHFVTIVGGLPSFVQYCRLKKD